MATLVVTSEKRQARAGGLTTSTGRDRGADLAARQHPPARRCLHLRQRDTTHRRPRAAARGTRRRVFLISPTSFFQTNVRAAENPGATGPRGSTGWRNRSRPLRGSGTLRASAGASRATPVVAIEENRSAVTDGEASLRLSRIPEARCRFIAKPVEIALGPGRRCCVARISTRSSSIHRAKDASRRSSIACFGDAGPRESVYVSCDPESLARDLARITACGYTIDSMQPVDMFPAHATHRDGGRPHTPLREMWATELWRRLPTADTALFTSPLSRAAFPFSTM